MFHQIKAIVTDIEGTCTSLSFVKETLFPYSRDNMEDFLSRHGQDPEIAPLLRQVAANMNNENATSQQLAAQLRQWIDADLKNPALKALQGHQWQIGYRQGDFHGHLYDDAYHAFAQWREKGIKLHVYSSGSVKAQKLLFSHTRFGDISGWFSGFFDTATGVKTEAQSYQRIVEEINLAAPQVLFLSDVIAELDAAANSGMQVACLQRDTVFPCNYFTARDFTALELNSK